MDNFVKTLIEEVKSLGVFDEFRFNCCLADVDTKPAYQNVRNRVETAVKDFLSKQKWTPDTNKVQLREQLRKHLLDTDVLIKGVDQIVDQVVNPKVATIFEPKIESIVYKYMGITPPPPPANAPPPRPPPLLPAPPLPPYALGNGSSLLKVETTASLLPTDLEQISPDSDRATVRSDLKEESKDELPPGVDDDDDSPLFEPLQESKPVENINGSLNTSDSRNKDLANDSRDAGASQVSQLSQVSSDSRLTIASSTDSAVEGNSQQPTQITPNMTANISEEAQMPKFSENSSEASDAASNGRRQLHFDINQDAIRFEGTERKNSQSETNNGVPQILSIEDAIMSEVKAVINDANHAAIEPDVQPEPEPEQKHSPPNVEEVQTVLHVEASPAIQSNPDIAEKKEEIPEESHQLRSDELKEEETQPEFETTEVPTPEILSTPKDEAVKSSESTSSPASSSSQSKKPLSKDKEKEKDRRHHTHSTDKQSHRSRERDRDHNRDKSHSKHSSNSSSKHSSSHSSSSKHRSSTSSSSKSSSNRSNRESSSSKRSSSSANLSRHESSSSSQKKHKSKSSSSRSDRDREKDGSGHNHSRSHNGSSSSSNAKKSVRDRDRSHNKSASFSTSAPPPVVQDDHNEAKAKIHKRRSSDSNDEGKPPGSGGPANKSPVEDVGSKETTNNNPESAQNGNGLSGNDGTNGKHEDANQLMDTKNVIVVSDILQQSSTSFIELSAASTVQKLEVIQEEAPRVEAEKEQISSVTAEVAVTESITIQEPNEANECQQKLKDQKNESNPQKVIISEEMKSKEQIESMEFKNQDMKSTDPQDVSKEPETASVEQPIKQGDLPLNSKKEEIQSGERKLETKEQNIKTEDQKAESEDPKNQSENQEESKEHQINAEEQQVVSKGETINETDEEKEMKVPQGDEIADHPSECVPNESKETAEVSNTKTAGDVETTSSNNKDVEMVASNNTILKESDRITHLEENVDEFKERLEVINQLIEGSQNVLTKLSADEPQTLLEARAMRRTASKRRVSKETTPTQQISPSGSSSSISSTGSSPANTNPSKRLRRDEVKSSPTTSETSINSKENEVLEKQEQVALLSTRRLSQKLCQQQRYTNDDLYKPRPVLSQRSRRRGLDSIL